MSEYIPDDDIDPINGKETTTSVHPSLAASFIPLPSDPNTPLTSDQLLSLFPNSGAWQEMILAVNRQDNTKPVEMQQTEIVDEHSANISDVDLKAS